MPDPRRKITNPAQEVARAIEVAGLTFRISLTDLLAMVGVAPAIYYAWKNVKVTDLYVSEYRRIMSVLDGLRKDPQYKMEAEAEAAYEARLPLRKRVVK